MNKARCHQAAHNPVGNTDTIPIVTARWDTQSYFAGITKNIWQVPSQSKTAQEKLSLFCFALFCFLDGQWRLNPWSQYYNWCSKENLSGWVSNNRQGSQEERFNFKLYFPLVFCIPGTVIWVQRKAVFRNIPKSRLSWSSCSFSWTSRLFIHWKR